MNSIIYFGVFSGLLMVLFNYVFFKYIVMKNIKWRWVGVPIMLYYLLLILGFLFVQDKYLAWIGMNSSEVRSNLEYFWLVPFLSSFAYWGVRAMKLRNPKDFNLKS